MFGIDSPELLVIAIVALVVIGPKELPGLLRTWGKWMAQMRGMASEFRGHVDEMVRQSELDEVKKQLDGPPPASTCKSLDPTKQIRAHIQEGMAEGEKAMAEAKSELRQSAGRARIGAADRRRDPPAAAGAGRDGDRRAAPAAPTTPPWIAAEAAAAEPASPSRHRRRPSRRVEEKPAKAARRIERQLAL